jgi:hypothetical protein
MPTPGSPPIFATVVFAKNKSGAIVSIPPLAAPTTFIMRAGAIYTSDGRELVIPDEPARARVLKAFGDDPSSVFVVETGPMGFVADHEITMDGAA